MQNLLFPDADVLLSGHVAGIDEAGRGPLAGGVFAAAVILDPARPIRGLNDSKVLTARRRDELALRIQERALAWHVASASVDEIDALNILQATMLAMKRAYAGLCLVPDRVLVDGNQLPQGLGRPAHAIIKGDARVAAIAAASILAKTARDADCRRLHGHYPEYGFDRHKGYATAEHMGLLQQHGPCAAHRRSFAPVARLLADASCEASGPVPAALVAP